MAWHSHLFQNFPQFAVIHTVQGFTTLLFYFTEAEVDVLLKLPCFLHDPTNAGNMTSDSSASSNNYLQGSLLSFIVYPNSEK